MKLKSLKKKAENALKFYKGIEGKNEKESNAIRNEFERLKSIASERKTEEKLQLADICKILFFSQSFHTILLNAI